MTTTFNELPTKQEDMLSHKLLSAEEEVDLAKRIEAGLFAQHILDGNKHKLTIRPTQEELEWLAKDGRESTEILIRSNLKLAMKTANKYRNRGFTADDIIQDAYQGVVKAVQKFDYAKGYKFSTYSVWWIRESILNDIHESTFLKYPEDLWNQIVKVRRARLSILDYTGEDPTVEEIAEEAKLTVREVEKSLREDKKIVSIQIPIGDGEDTLGDLIDDQDSIKPLANIEDLIIRDNLKEIISEILENIPDQVAAQVFAARYGLNGETAMTPHQVSRDFGISRQQVRTYENQCLTFMRKQNVRQRFIEYKEELV